MTDLVERQAVLDAIHLFFTEEIDKIPTKKTEDGEVYVIHKCQPLFAMNKAICKRIKELPSVNPQEQETGHCKDCKYFEYDSVAKVDGIPLIVAHEICSRWSDGCKTKEDGYCFLFEPQESERINCKSTKCENCQNHNYCDYEPQESEV